MSVTIFNAGSPASMELHVDVVPRVPGAEWQAIRPAYRLISGVNFIRIFAGAFSRNLVIRAAPEVLAKLHWQALDAAVPPIAGEADMPVACLTAARLHELGVHKVQNILLTDDPRWPLRSISDDPQLRFAPPRAGLYRIRVQLEVESGAGQPAVYINDGHGFSSHTAIGLSPSGDSWVGSVRFTRRCVSWRLDPVAKSGALSLARVELQRVEAKRRWSVPPQLIAPLKRRWESWLAHARGYWTMNDLLPAHDLTEIQGSANHYRAAGYDPHFRLSGRVRAGWYILEARLTLPAAISDARVYLDYGAGESEGSSFGFRLRSGKTAARLLRLPAASRLRFDPMATNGELTVEHFSLRRVQQAVALKEMKRELLASHPMYRAQVSQQTGTSSPAIPLPTGLKEMWVKYRSLFEDGEAQASSYADWIDSIEKPNTPSAQLQVAEAAAWVWRPRLSIVVPTYNTPVSLLRDCLDSVLAQTYDNWELCIADDASTNADVGVVLREYASREPRVRLAFRERNGHIAVASNTALDLATGEFIVLLDHDDLLPPHALFHLAQVLQQHTDAQLIYSDEDKIDEAGRRCQPFFKPDWSPDLLYSQNFFSHLGMYRRELVKAAGGFRAGFEGSQDYDLVLRCVAMIKDSRQIVHVPRVLYHWRMVEGSTARSHDQKDYASEAGRRALQDYFDGNFRGVQVGITHAGIYRHRWPIPEPRPLVSLIVPTRDGIDVLRKCIESIVRLTTYRNFEILVVDNQSTCKKTLAYLEALDSGAQGRGHVRVLRYDHPFNYSAINNFAVAHARGSVLGLINNDVEVINRDWLTEMISHAVRPDVGCVGAKLYYADDTIQHAGVVLGLGGVANHAMRLTPRNAPGYFGRLWTIYNPSAVTAAVLLIRRSLFEDVGGLDADSLPVAFNDVDLCLKIMAAGYRNVWTPFAEFYHFESATRGADSSPEKRKRFLGEIDVMLKRWGTVLKRDPHYNQNLARVGSGYALNLEKWTTDEASLLAGANSP